MANFHLDQAAGLRRIMAQPQPRIVSILSALGRTNGSHNDLHRILGNLAASLMLEGSKAHIVYAMDCEIDTLKYYGLLNTPSLSEIIMHEQPFEHAVSTIRNSFTASRLGCIQDIASPLAQKVSRHIIRLAELHDIVMVETTVDAHQSLPLQLLNDGVIIIQVNHRAASIKKAYSLIKQLSARLGQRHFGILVHGNNAKNAANIFNNIATVAQQFLSLELEYMGYIPTDEHMNKAFTMGRSVVDAFPTTGIAIAFRELAKRLLKRSNQFSTPDTSSLI